MQNSLEDIEKRGLRPESDFLYNRPIGVTMGRYHWQYFCKPEWMDGHILGFGKTGKQKTTSIGIPTGLSWRGTFFAPDMKGDIAKAVKPFRTHLKVIDPCDEESFGFDPLWKLKFSDQPNNEIKKIGLRLIPETPNSENRFFVDSARNILMAVIQNYYDKGYSFIDMIDILKKMKTHDLVVLLYEGGNIEVRSKLKELIDAANSTFNSISQELSTYLTLYYDSEPIRSLYSRKNNFIPYEIESWDGLFVIPPEELDNWRPVINYVLTDIFDYLFTRPDGITDPILLMLDEFASLGYFPKMLSYITTLRSKKVTIMPICQSPAQIDELYGELVRRIFVDNAEVIWTLGSGDPDSAEYISRLMGRYDKVDLRQSYRRDKLAESPETRISESEKKTMLTEVEDLMTMRDEVFVRSPTGFHRLTKTRYDHSAFKRHYRNGFSQYLS